VPKATEDPVENKGTHPDNLFGTRLAVERGPAAKRYNRAMYKVEQVATELHADGALEGIWSRWNLFPGYQFPWSRKTKEKLDAAITKWGKKHGKDVLGELAAAKKAFEAELASEKERLHESWLKTKQIPYYDAFALHAPNSGTWLHQFLKNAKFP